MSKLYEYNGESHSLRVWAKKYNINHNTLRCRIGKQKLPIDEALTKPLVPQSERKRKDIVTDEYIYLNKQSFLRATENTETNEKFITIKDEICSHFGCSRKLTITEKLYGNKCFKHS